MYGCINLQINRRDFFFGQTSFDLRDFNVIYEEKFVRLFEIMIDLWWNYGNVLGDRWLFCRVMKHFLKVSFTYDVDQK